MSQISPNTSNQDSMIEQSTGMTDAAVAGHECSSANLCPAQVNPSDLQSCSDLKYDIFTQQKAQPQESV